MEVSFKGEAPAPLVLLNLDEPFAEESFVRFELSSDSLFVQHKTRAGG